MEGEDVVARLRRENEGLRQHLECLKKDREDSKEKVRAALQSLVEEYRRLEDRLRYLEGSSGDQPQTEEPLKQQSARIVEIFASATEERNLDDTTDVNSSLEASETGEASDEEMEDAEFESGSLPRRVRSMDPDKMRRILGIQQQELSAAAQVANNGVTIEKRGIAMMTNPDNTIEVRGGLAEKLVKRLHHRETLKKSPLYISTFILTHPSYCTTQEALQYLKKSFLSIMPDDGERGARRKERILGVLREWVDLQPEHFYGEGLDDFKDFMHIVLLETGNVTAKAIWKKISKIDVDPLEYALKLHASKRKPRDKASIPKPITPKAIMTVEDISVVELARQLTLVDYELFQRIRVSECLSCAWTKNKEGNFLNRVSRRFNEVSRWIQYQIVSRRVLKKRAAMYKFFVMLGDEFRKLQNYNGILQVTSALGATAVHRLTKNMERCLNAQTVKTFRYLLVLMSSSSGYKKYRDALERAKAPGVPYMGMWQTDLTAIEESHKKTMEPQHPEYINFNKHMMVAKIMRKVLELQNGDYPLQPVGPIRDWLESQITIYADLYDDEKLYKLSQDVEPKQT